MSKFGRRVKQTPEGYDYIEPTITALENELREKINEPHEGLRKTESQWPVHQINWQKSRYVYDMYYVHHKISREVYDYCVKNKVVDAALIAKWKKPGYERLCSTYVINPRNYKFGTVSICRVPTHCLAEGTEIEDATTGCRGCASGSGNAGNIFGNKYGQYLAAIQIAREEKEAMAEEDSDDDDDEDDEKEDASTIQDAVEKGNAGLKRKNDQDEYLGPVGAADGSSGTTGQRSVWADSVEESSLHLDVNVENSAKKQKRS
mmetsp:Transcript_2949/g.5302  ORF Transcript_2949/g.5302 Transcript_2949/m.5302 type:complete len:261 (+) Transcript_2949:95-877(+)